MTLSIEILKRLFYGLRTSQPAAPYQAPRIEWKQSLTQSESNTESCVQKPSLQPRSPVSQTAVLAGQESCRILEDQWTSG